jgi:tRNA-(ms[2]io[6]A)-hydroxylase
VAAAVFGLEYATPPAWVARVEREPLALLSDHAHCELRAAASAQALIVRNPARSGFVAQMLALAQEELEHFGRVAAELEARGGRLDHKAPNPYADRLLAASVPDRGDAFLDRLLIAALIEARSLERFRLLAEHLADAGLAGLYRELLPSEARHRTLFVDLAREAFGNERADARHAELRAREAGVMAALPFAVRIHSGCGREASSPVVR